MVRPIPGPIRDSRRQQKSRAVAVPPPVKGWNTRDALDAMDTEDAILLDNWFPRESDVVTRNGTDEHCDTGEGTDVETLAEYASGGTRKLLAGVNGKIVDVSTSTPSTLATGYTSNIHYTENFGGRLFGGNGLDAPWDYNGSSVSSTSWSGSGLTVSNLIVPFAFKSRLFWVEKNTANFWYGSTGAISGTLTKFALETLQSVAGLGGTLVALGSITRDGGDGEDDLFCAFMSTGQVVVYQGTDPGDATKWGMIGIFNIGPLITRRMVLKVGADLVVGTLDGYIPISSLLRSGRTGNTRFALSDKIQGAARDAANRYRANDGWGMAVYPAGSQLIINVPTSALESVQHVMNTRTGAWCRFTGMRALCWSGYDDGMYYGGADGVVYQADTGTDDNGTTITADAQTAWNYFGNRGARKRWTGVRTVMVSPDLSIALGVDFAEILTPSTQIVTTTQSGGQWDDAEWDDGEWSSTPEPERQWRSARGLGYCASLRVVAANPDAAVQWLSTQYLMETGGLV